MICDICSSVLQKQNIIFFIFLQCKSARFSDSVTLFPRSGASRFSTICMSAFFLLELIGHSRLALRVSDPLGQVLPICLCWWLWHHMTAKALNAFSPFSTPSFFSYLLPRLRYSHFYVFSFFSLFFFLSFSALFTLFSKFSVVVSFGIRFVIDFSFWEWYDI